MPAGRACEHLWLRGPERGWFQCYQLGTDRGAPAPAGPAPLCPARPQPRAQGDRAPVPGALLSEGNPQPRLFIHRRGPAAAGGGRGGAAGGGHGSRWVRGEGGFSPRDLFLLWASGAWKPFLWCCRWTLCCPYICSWVNVISLQSLRPEGKHGLSTLKGRMMVFVFHCSHSWQNNVRQNRPAVLSFRKSGIFTSLFFLDIRPFSNGSRL